MVLRLPPLVTLVAFVLAAFVALVAACDDGTSPPPAVSFIEVTPGDTLLAPGDSAAIRGQPVGVKGELLDLPLTFEVEDPAVGTVEIRDSAVFRTAVFRALDEGDTRVVVREEGGVAAFVPVRIRHVTGFSPEFAAFGGTVTLSGRGFGADSRVFFGSPPGATRWVSDDGTELRAWVPWDAENAPLRVVLADGGEARTEEPFVLTGGADDALEPNGIFMSSEVEVPFRNPFLRTRITSMDNFSFSLDRATAVTVRVSDGEEVNTWSLRSVVQMNRVDELGEIYGVAPVYSFGRDQPQDGIIAHSSLPPGRYAVRVFVGAEFGAVDRRYGILIDTLATYTREPDRFEPNTLPAEAPFLETPLEDTLTIENPWGQDYYRLRVDERSRVRVEVATLGRSKGVFFYKDEQNRSVQWHLLDPDPFPQTWTGVVTSLSPIEIQCNVEPGEYVIGVLENEGVEGPYGLLVEMEPSESEFFNCRQPDPDGASSLEAGRLRAEALGLPR